MRDFGKPQGSQIVTVAAAVLCGAGTMLPLVGVPLLRDRNFFQLSPNGAWILVGLTAVSLLIALTRKYQALYVTGLASLALVVYTLMAIHLKRSGYQQNIEDGMDKSPIRDLGASFMKNVTIRYGWWVMLIGAILLVAVPLVGSRLAPARPKAEKPPSAE
jgi:hypothetical protein